MSQGQNSSNQREQNERLILLLMREHQQLSKTDIAQLTGLTYPTVARIVDTLATKYLVRKKGIQKKPLGKPTALYEIEANGRLAMGIEIRNNRLVIAVINFHGTLLLMQEYPIPHQTTIALADHIYNWVIELVINLQLEQQKALIGIGLIDSGNEKICIHEIKPHLDHRLKTQNNQSVYQLSLIIVPPGIATAAANIIKSAARVKRDALHIHIGLDIDGCFIFANQINLHRPSGRTFLGSMPIGSTEVTPSSSLNEQSSLASLYRHLGAAPSLEPGHFDEPEQTPATKQIISEWIQNAAKALAFSIETSASLHHLDEVILDSPMPQAWLSALIDNIKRKVSPRLCDRIHGELTSDETAIIGSAAVLLIDSLNPHTKTGSGLD